MEPWLSAAKPYLEALYHASWVFVAAGTVAAVRQLALMKRDIVIRSERAAKEKAVAAAESYLCDFVALNSVWFNARIKQNVPLYSGPVGNFTYESIPETLRSATKARYHCREWLPGMNKLEAVAAMFTTGVADENVGFEIIGRSFCATVENDYDLIVGSRGELANPYWRNIEVLYRVWAPRLAKAELSKVREEVSRSIGRIEDRHIRPIGEGDGS